MDLKTQNRTLHYRSLGDLEDWQRGSEEEIIEPELPIVDPHHHLWQGTETWTRHRGTYLLNEFLAETNSGHNVIGSVYVETRAMYRAAGPEHMKPVGETEFVNGVAAMSASGNYGPARLCAGIVGFADLTLGDRVSEVLEAHVIAGGKRFRGIRQPAARDASSISTISPRRPPQGLLLDDKFRAGFARLAEFGLSYDVFVFHPQHAELFDLARAFPETTIVVGHVGGPLGIDDYAGRREEISPQWRSSLGNLAKCPNVMIKLGGLGMLYPGFNFHLRPSPPSSEEMAQAWRPYIEACIELFGAERCMFESNFPVDKQSCSYAVLWNALKRTAVDASADEKAALFSGTATRVYRLDFS